MGGWNRKSVFFIDAGGAMYTLQKRTCKQHQGVQINVKLLECQQIGRARSISVLETIGLSEDYQNKEKLRP